MVMRFFQGRFGGKVPDVEALKSRADTAGLVIALRHPEPAVREASAAALGQLGDPETIPALVNALSDPEWMVRRGAVRALSWMQVGWSGSQSAPTGENRQNPAHGAERVRSQTDDELMDRVSHSRRVTAALVQALQDEVWQVREAAAETLSAIGPGLEDQAQRTSLAEALLVSLGDERLTVRKAAAGALVGLGSPRLRSLSTALNDSDWRRREGAAVALGLMGQGIQDGGLQAQIVTILAATLSDPDPRLRLAAVRALGQIGQCLEDRDHRHQAVESLASTLADQDGQVRESAARALGRIGDARAAGPLVELLQDPKESVQNAAAQALDRLARAQGIQTGPLRSR